MEDHRRFRCLPPADEQLIRDVENDGDEQAQRRGASPKMKHGHDWGEQLKGRQIGREIEINGLSTELIERSNRAKRKRREK